MTDTDDLLRRLRDSANEIALAGHNGWGNACAAAADEIERLRAEVADLREPRLLRMDATGARLEMELTGGMCRLFAESFATDFQASGATNYLEAQFTSNDVMPGERFVVTVQRVEGKTPHQLRADADARATRAESELAALRGED